MLSLMNYENGAYFSFSLLVTYLQQQKKKNLLILLDHSMNSGADLVCEYVQIDDYLNITNYSVGFVDPGQHLNFWAFETCTSLFIYCTSHCILEYSFRNVKLHFKMGFSEYNWEVLDSIVKVQEKNAQLLLCVLGCVCLKGLKHKAHLRFKKTVLMENIQQLMLHELIRNY